MSISSIWLSIPYRYMIDKLGFEPDNALAAYATGRRYPVERENYIKDLKKGKRLVDITLSLCHYRNAYLFVVETICSLQSLFETG